MAKYIDPRDRKTVLTEHDIKDMLKAGKDPLNNQHKLSWIQEKTLRELRMLQNKTKEENWDKWPIARKDYWAKREILTHNEFIYLLKEKEPRSLKLKPTQFDYFPIEFCTFHDETVRIIEDFRVMKKIIPIYYDAHSQIGFKTIDLIELALSKNIHVPNWLLPEPVNTIEKAPKASVEQYPFLDKNDPFYSTKFHHAFECWMSLYGPKGSIRKIYNENMDETMKDNDNFGTAIYSWLGHISKYNAENKKSGAACEIFKVINPNKNPRNNKK